jgi:hypothetical protein
MSIDFEKAGLIYGQRAAGEPWHAISIVNGEASERTVCGESVPGLWYDFAFRPTKDGAVCARCAAVSR